MHVLRNFRVFKGPEWSITDQQADSAADHITPTSDSSQSSSHRSLYRKKVKVALTRLLSVGFRSWSRFLAVSLLVTWVINPAIGCNYFPPGLQLPSRPLRGLVPISLLGEQRHDGCEQFAYDWYPTASRLRFKPRSYCAWVQHANGSNGILSPGLWLTSPAGWLPRTGISSGTLRSVIEYGLSLLYSD